MIELIEIDEPGEAALPSYEEALSTAGKDSAAGQKC